MNLELRRINKMKSCTEGQLYIDGEYFCDTLEDCDRGLTTDMSNTTVKSVKIPGETAIPAGTYDVITSIQSPKFSQKSAYSFCRGYLPRLVNVPGFDGILIHDGGSATDSCGCILVGTRDRTGHITNSMNTLKKLCAKLKEPISMTIN